jgi:hypothetical protein
VGTVGTGFETTENGRLGEKDKGEFELNSWSDDELERKRLLEADISVPVNMSQAKDAPHKNLLKWANPNNSRR